MKTKCDFTYDHYIETVLEYKEDSIILRHDVDMSLDKALSMARVENENGIKSIYFILLTNPYYNPLGNLAKLKELVHLGHGIGLHCDYNKTDRVLEQIHFLKTILGVDIQYTSIHNPTMGKSPNMDEINNMGIHDCSLLDSKYISDSGRNWREDCFCKHIGKHKLLQVNTHPEWWCEESNTWDESYNDIWIKHHLSIDNLYKEARDNLMKYYDKLGIRKSR